MFHTCLISFHPRKVLMALASFVFELLILYSLWFLFSCWRGITMDRSRTALTTNHWVMSFFKSTDCQRKASSRIRFTVSGKCACNETQVKQLTLLKSAPSRYTPLTHSTKNVPVTYFSQLCVFSHFEVIIHTQLPQPSIHLCVVTPLFSEPSLNKSFFL